MYNLAEADRKTSEQTEYDHPSDHLVIEPIGILQIWDLSATKSINQDSRAMNIPQWLGLLGLPSSWGQPGRPQ